MTEASEESPTENGNSKKDVVEIASSAVNHSVRLINEAWQLRENLVKGNTEDDKIEVESDNHLVHTLVTPRGKEIFTAIPSGTKVTLSKKLETDDGYKEIIVGHETMADVLDGKLRRVDAHGALLSEVKIPTESISATVDIVLGDLSAKIAERQQNTTEAIYADIAEVLGTEYPPTAPTPET